MVYSGKASINVSISYHIVERTWCQSLGDIAKLSIKQPTNYLAQTATTNKTRRMEIEDGVLHLTSLSIESDER